MDKTRKRILIIMLVLTALNCKEGSKTSNKIIDAQSVEIAQQKEIPYEVICKLNEGIGVIGQVASLDILDESRFVLADEKHVWLYNTDGTQLRKIGTRGKGPGEYLSPNRVRVDGNKIYVGCQRLGRIIAYDEKGHPVQTHTLERAIDDFVVSRGSAALYSAGGFKGDKVLKIYDLQTKTFTGSYGEKTKAHRIMNIFACSGGLAKSGHSFLFLPTDRLNLWKINPKIPKAQQWTIHDPEFQVEKTSAEANDLLSTKIDREGVEADGVTDFFYSNASVAAVFSTKDRIIVKVSTGRVKWYKHVNEGAFDERKIKYYMLNKDFELTKVIQTHYTGASDCLYAVHQDTIYQIILGGSNGDIHYKLVRLDL